MAQVLTPSLPSYRSNPTTRSASRTSLCNPNQSYGAAATDLILYSSTSHGFDPRIPASMPSSAPSSPRLQNHDTSSQPSRLSTPSSSLSLDEEYCSDNVEDDFPSFPDSQDLVGQSKMHSPSPLEHQEEEGSNADEGTNSDEVKNEDEEMDEFDYDDVVEDDEDEDEDILELREKLAPIDSSSQVNVVYQSFVDDTTLKREPSRHVDYLSHDWREEDIWCSWRHIVARRKVLDNAQRLENASWRTWAKSQNRLKTVSPEKLNWMKDHDVTWLYGPLQTTNSQNFDLDSPTTVSRFSRRDSFLDKKPILKRRSVSEVMLQRSLSNSTLVRQAVDALASQEPIKRSVRPNMGARVASDLECVPAPTPRTFVAETPSPMVGSSTTPSGTQSPNVEKRRIHFNNKVEQCIAIDKDLDELDDNSKGVHDGHSNGDEYVYGNEDDDESSDDGIIMMRTEMGKERKLNHITSTPRSSFSFERYNHNSGGSSSSSNSNSNNHNNSNKTIAMLPSTTLKYRCDTPEPAENPTNQNGSFWMSERKLKQSSSSETLRPAKPSSNFLLDDEDEEADMSWQPSSLPRSVMKNTVYPRGGISVGAILDEDEEMESRGLRRTPSGMFMPYEGDNDAENVGLFGKVVDTVNTARDIAHVIWNVGWRR